MPLSPKATPIQALAVDGEVVLLADGPGRPIEASFTPEAILASLEPMRAAAEQALRQRAANDAPLRSGGAVGGAD